MNEHLVTILKKMCEYVDVNYEDVEWKNDNDPYYMKHEWTEDQQSDFVDWLTDYLYTNRDARLRLTNIISKNKKRCRATAEHFNWNYGWKTKK